GCALDAADVLSHASVNALAEHVLAVLAREAVERERRPPEHPVLEAEPVCGASGAPEPIAVEPIAVIGLGCRLPGGADDPQSFWQLLADRRDTTGPVPAERWDATALLSDGKTVAPGRSSTARGSFLPAVDGFDHGFFRVSPREARSMDPQQRIFLEV